MTIAAGFRCADGVLLCADSQLTIPAYLKFPEAKIISMSGVKFSPCFAYCGDVAFSKDSIHRIGETIHTAEDDRNLMRAIRGVAREIYLEQKLLSREERETLELLVVMKRGSRFQLWHLRRLNLSPIQECIPIGAGMDMMYATAKPFYSPAMKLREASFMGAYALYLTKEYVDSVGKNSLIYLIFDDGRRAVVTQEEIEELEQSFGEFRSASATVLTECDGTAFGDGLNRLETKLREAFAKRERRELLFL